MRSLPQFYKWTYALLVCLAIMPAVLLLTLILKYGVDVPYWDEWHYVTFFEKFSQSTLTLGDLFAQQNEYRQFFPNLIFVGLGWLTKWNKRYELLVSFALACLVSFNLYRLGKSTIGGTPLRRIMIYLIANILIFSPVQYDNWLLGMQIIYFMPIACLTTCLVIAYSNLSPRAKFLAGMCLAGVSTFSSANGILCWLVLPLFTWPNSRRELANKKWLVLAWTVGFVLSAALYFKGYQSVSGHPSLFESLVHPLKASGYFLILLGKTLEPGAMMFLRQPFGTGHKVIAGATGLTLIVFFVVSALRIQKDTGLAHRAAGWLMLGTYSIMTGILITTGRVGFGMDQAFSARYTTFTLYLPIALVHLLPLILEGHNMSDGRVTSRNKVLLYGLATSVIVSQLLIYPWDIKQMSGLSKRLSQSKACLLLVNVIEADCLRSSHPSVEHLKLSANTLDRLNFLRPGLIKSNRVQDIATPEAESPKSYGSLESIVHTGEDVYTASGWAVHPQGGDAADAILLTYDRAPGDSVIFAVANTGNERAVFARMLGMSSPPNYAGWQKPFSVNDLPASPAIITAWAFDSRNGKAVRLDGSYIIQKQLSWNPNEDHVASEGSR
ncbi:MAG: hypothetical protein ABR568_16465 [Pyrinomonadaceae bacterium]